MGQTPMRAAGHVLRHAVGVLLLSWVRALRAGVIAGLVGVLLVELAAMLMTGRFPPDGTAQLVAGLFGFALAFGVAATVVIDEILEGIREFMGMVQGEAEAGARVAATLVAREVGDSSASVLRVVGLGRLLSPRPNPDMPAPTDATAPARPDAVTIPAGIRAASRGESARTGETLAELASEPRTSLRQRADASPVPADRLPRLDWTDEHPAVRPVPAAPAAPLAEIESATVEPDTWQIGEDASATSADGPTGADTPTDEPPGATGPVAAAPTVTQAASGLVEPAEWHTSETPSDSDFTWHDPVVATEPQDDEESYIQPIDVFGAPPPLAPPPPAPVRDAEPLTRPLPETTRPLPVDALDTSPRGSVWDHISQVLAGRPVAPLPEEPAAADDGAEEVPPAAH